MIRNKKRQKCFTDRNK